MYKRVIPSPEHESPSDTRVQTWDYVMIEALIETYHSWYAVGYPVESADKLWSMTAETMRRNDLHRLYMAVRQELPKLPIVVNYYGDSPGAEGYAEVVFTDDEDGFRRICFGGPFDGESYQSADGRTIHMQVWYTDDEGTLDIIECDHMNVERLAAAVLHMWEKWDSRYVNDDITVCPFNGWESRDPDVDECPPEWAQIDCQDWIVKGSGLCVAHHNAQPGAES